MKKRKIEVLEKGEWVEFDESKHKSREFTHVLVTEKMSYEQLKKQYPDYPLPTDTAKL